MAEHDDVLAVPQIEMADPELLVDEGDELQDLVAPPFGHLEVEGAGECTASTSSIQVKATW